MSGIAAIFHNGTPKPVDPARIAALLATMGGRGDQRDSWFGAGIGIGLCRREDRVGLLMADEAVVAVDGTISNRAALCALLKKAGRPEADAAPDDAALILLAWSCWGPECVRYVDGRCAFLIYDRRSQSLLLVRDRLGARPLLYTELGDGAVLVASDLRAIIAHPLFRRSPSMTAVDDYLALGFVPDDSSLMTGVHKLPAGSLIQLRRGEHVPSPSEYWDPSYASAHRAPPRGELGAALLDVWRSSIAAGPEPAPARGAVLQNTLGDPLVLALLAESSKRAVSTVSLGAVSLGGERENPSTDPSSALAERFAARHVDRRADAAPSLLLDRLGELFDEPHSGHQAVATLLAAESLAGRAGRVMVGEGLGYLLPALPRHHRFSRINRWRRFGLGTLAGPAARIFPPTPWSAEEEMGWRAFLDAVARGDARAYAQGGEASGGSARRQLLTPQARGWLGNHCPSDRYRRAMARVGHLPPLAQLQYADLRIRLPADLLARLDHVSTGLGLDIEAPLLSSGAVSLFMARRSSLRGAAGNLRLVEALAEQFVPARMRPAAIDVPDRGSPDLISGFDLAAEAGRLVSRSMLVETGWFDMSLIGQLAADHVAHRRHTALLWRLLILDRSLARLFG